MVDATENFPHKESCLRTVCALVSHCITWNNHTWSVAEWLSLRMVTTPKICVQKCVRIRKKKWDLKCGLLIIVNCKMLNLCGVIISCRGVNFSMELQNGVWILTHWDVSVCSGPKFLSDSKIPVEGFTPCTYICAGDMLRRYDVIVLVNVQTLGLV